MKKLPIVFVIIIAIFLAPQRSDGLTITFDDLGIGVPDPADWQSGIGTVPDGYAGFNWDRCGVIHKHYYPGSGLEYGTISGEYAGYNEWYQVVTVDSSLFIFDSVYLAAVWEESLEVTVTGYRAGSVAFADTVAVNNTGPTFVEFSPTKIDTLKFSPATPEDFMLDDLSYSTVPVPPDAGPNVAIPSEEHIVTIIQEGTAFDPDGDPLEYRWLEGGVELSSWADVAPNGEAHLDLATVPQFAIGTYTLTLEVRLAGTQDTATDTMVLTVVNSSPHAAPTGGGIYELSDPVTIGGDVSDFDGDELTYEWLYGGNILFSGVVSTIYLGYPVSLPNHDLADLGLGTHTLTLRVDDGVNAPVSEQITIEVIDTTAPTLAPKPSKGILWPPNHKMVPISIAVNAEDNSGGSVAIAASVASNEPEDGLGDGDTGPDWTVPDIDQENGIIYVDLRSERSGTGEGRVYTVTITVTDESNNSSQATVEIIVPHDMRRK